MPNPEPAPSADKAPSDESQSRWSGRAGPIFWAGLVVGMLLAIGGFASLSGSLVGTTNGQLILCSGLGIIFGAFGSTGTAKYKGVVITGVAAIAIVLLLIVDYLIEDSYVELEITGDIRGAQIEVVGDVNYLGAPRERSHDFIIIGREIRRNLVMAAISLPPEADSDGAEYLFDCIHKEEIERFLGSGQTIQWRFDKEKAQLFDSGSQRIVAEVGGCGVADAERYVEPPADGGLAALGFSFFSQAFALDSADAGELLERLEAESAYTRRQARESLAALGLPAVPPMLDRLMADQVSYRTRLGVIVAMTEMLRANKDKRQEVSKLMTQDHINAFIEASTDKDRTMRIYASEFLYDLGDVRVALPLFDYFESTDDNGKYNLLVVLDGAYPYLDASTRTQVNQKLSGIADSVGPKTKQLVERLTKSEKRYWVIIASYRDKGQAQEHADRINTEDSGLKAFVGLRQPNNEYYPVIVGDYVPRPEALELVKKALQLKSIREYGSPPYLSAYADRRP